MQDQYKRNIDYLRVSITDKCNLRCVYCMPEDGVERLSHEDILSFDEIVQICTAAASKGVRKIKITGGEPLVRKNVVQLIAQIKQILGIEQVTMTTNGVLFAPLAKDLKEAGLDSVNFSLDTLSSDNFSRITRRNEFDRVKEALQAALEAEIKSVKVNCVAISQFNGDELCDIASLAQNDPIHVRFIELMPIGLGKQFSPITKENIMAKLEKKFGTLKPDNHKHGNGPAEYYIIDGFKGSIGFISAISHQFCSECNRIRMSADGNLKLCLHYEQGIALKPLLRAGISQEDLEKVIADAVFHKPRQHHFLNPDSEDEAIEEKNMVDIGG